MKWILPAILFSLLFIFCIHTLTDINQDIGLHLTTGKLIWQTHQILRTNYFSYTNPDFPFVNHHWLAQVFLYLLSLVGGLKGLILFKAIIFTVSFALVFFAFYRKESLSMSIITGLLSIFVLIDRSAVRVEMFSFLFLGWYLFVIFNHPNSKWFWFLPIVQLIWVNAHIYFFLGPMIYLFFVIGRFIEDRKTFKSQAPRLFKIGALIFLANLINPFGLKGAISPFLVVNDFGVPILELLSPFEVMHFNYPVLSIYTFFISLVFVSISFIVNRRNFKNNIFGTSIIFVSAVLGLMMIRNMAVFSLVLLPVTVKNFYEAGVYWQNKFFRLLLSFLVIILALSVVTGQLKVGNRQFGLIIPNWGQKAVDFVKNNNISGPVFNNINTGSFLIWRLPGQPVFIDTHPEAYPKDFVRNVFMAMQSDPEKWKLYSEKYGVNYIFFAYREATPWSQKFMKDISKNPAWPLVYLDENIAIFVKNVSQNKEVVEKYKINAQYK